LGEILKHDKNLSVNFFSEIVALSNRHQMKTMMATENPTTNADVSRGFPYTWLAGVSCGQKNYKY
jgi:hypothetical protein